MIWLCRLKLREGSGLNMNPGLLLFNRLKSNQVVCRGGRSCDVQNERDRWHTEVLAGTVFAPTFPRPEQLATVMATQSNIQMITANMSGHCVLLSHTAMVTGGKRTLIVRTSSIQFGDVFLSQSRVGPCEVPVGVMVVALGVP